MKKMLIAAACLMLLSPACAGASLFGSDGPKDTDEITPLQYASLLGLRDIDPVMFRTKLMPLIDALFCEVNPIPVKAAMPLVGFPCGSCRMPLSLIEPDHLALLQQQFTMTKQLGLC